jgi:hypothetical protein
MPEFPLLELAAPVFVDEDYDDNGSEAVIMECPCCGVNEFAQRGVRVVAGEDVIMRLRCLAGHDFDVVLRLEDKQFIVRCQVYSAPQEALP